MSEQRERHCRESKFGFADCDLCSDEDYPCERNAQKDENLSRWIYEESGNTGNSE